MTRLENLSIDGWRGGKHQQLSGLVRRGHLASALASGEGTGSPLYSAREPEVSPGPYTPGVRPSGGCGDLYNTAGIGPPLETPLPLPNWVSQGRASLCSLLPLENNLQTDLTVCTKRKKERKEKKKAHSGVIGWDRNYFRYKNEPCTAVGGRGQTDGRLGRSGGLQYCVLRVGGRRRVIKPLPGRAAEPD